MILNNPFLLNFYRIIRPIVPTKIHYLLLTKLRRRPGVSKALWKPSSQITVPSGDLPKITILAIIHIHYLDYIEKINKISLTHFSNAEFKFIFTTSSDTIANKISEVSHLGAVQVIVTENKGRHFGSLFQAISNVEVEKYDFILHLHSKRSPHAHKSFGEIWATKLWDALLLKQEIAFSALKIMQGNPKIGLYYPEVLDVVSSYGYTWKHNKDQARRILDLLGARTNLSSSRFPFPAGGMFIVKTEALRNLFDLRITQDWFNEEAGALDGQLEHAMERLVGYLATINGFSHLIYSDNQNLFTTDTSYVNFDTTCKKSANSNANESTAGNG
jgi:lipopolysaccharide biosynthesis protein